MNKRYCITCGKFIEEGTSATTPCFCSIECEKKYDEMKSNPKVNKCHIVFICMKLIEECLFFQTNYSNLYECIWNKEGICTNELAIKDCLRKREKENATKKS